MLAVLAGGTFMGIGDATPGWHGPLWTAGGIAVSLPGMVVIGAGRVRLRALEATIDYYGPLMSRVASGEFVSVQHASAKLNEIFMCHLNVDTDPCHASGRPWPCDVVNSLDDVARQLGAQPMPLVPQQQQGES
jgi:hypothetical protein